MLGDGQGTTVTPGPFQLIQNAINNFNPFNQFNQQGSSQNEEQPGSTETSNPFQVIQNVISNFNPFNQQNQQNVGSQNEEGNHTMQSQNPIQTVVSQISQSVGSFNPFSQNRPEGSNPATVIQGAVSQIQQVASSVGPTVTPPPRDSQHVQILEEGTKPVDLSLLMNNRDSLTSAESESAPLHVPSESTMSKKTSDSEVVNILGIGVKEEENGINDINSAHMSMKSVKNGVKKVLKDEMKDLIKEREKEVNKEEIMIMMASE